MALHDRTHFDGQPSLFGAAEVGMLKPTADGDAVDP